MITEALPPATLFPPLYVEADRYQFFDDAIGAGVPVPFYRTTPAIWDELKTWLADHRFAYSLHDEAGNRNRPDWERAALYAAAVWGLSSTDAQALAEATHTMLTDDAPDYW